jgi:hypothetical protein
MSNGDFWSSEVWATINGTPNDPTKPGLLKATMGPMEVARSVFPTIITGNDNPIPADTIDLATGVPSTGETRSFAALRKPFQLAPIHVSDPALTLAMNQVANAAQALAVVEDMLFFQGTDAPLPAAGAQRVVVTDVDKEKLDEGLLGIADGNHDIVVHPIVGPGRTYGLRIYNAVVEGIQRFTADQQGPPYGLVLAPDIFGQANLPLALGAFVTPASAIQPLLLSGSFTVSPGMPAWTGLLASLGGKSTTLYIGTSPLVEFSVYVDSNYFFNARESLQFLNTDPRSLIKLTFDNNPE